MSDAVADAPEEPKKKRGMLLPLVLAAALGAGGFASSYLGFWSPLSLLGSAEAEAAAAAEAVPQVEFVDVPRIQLTIPAQPPRILLLSAKIETTTADRAEVEHLMPRVVDAFNTFLSDIDPAAFGKRGVLEIVRAELVTRTRYVLGDEPVKDLLITEFMLQ